MVATRKSDLLDLAPRARIAALRDALRRRFGSRVVPDPRSLAPVSRGRHPSRGVVAERDLKRLP